MNKEKKEKIKIKLSEILHKIADFLILGLISLICSLPIITLGAAACAFYTVGRSLVREEEGALYRDYFAAFAHHFKKGTLYWLILLFILLLLTGNSLFYYYMAGNGAIWAQIGLGVCFAVGILISLLGSFLFPLLIRNEDMRAVDLLKTAFYLSVRHLGWWAAKAAGQIILATAVWLVPFLIVFAPGLLLFWNSYCAERIFRHYYHNQDDERENGD